MCEVGIGSPFSQTRPEVYKALAPCVFTEGSWGCGLFADRQKPFSQTRPEVHKALAPLCLQRAPGGVAYCSQTEAL